MLDGEHHISPQNRSNGHRFYASYFERLAIVGAQSVAYRALSRVGGNSPAFGLCGVSRTGVETEAVVGLAVSALSG